MRPDACATNLLPSSVDFRCNRNDGAQGEGRLQSVFLNLRLAWTGTSLRAFVTGWQTRTRDILKKTKPVNFERSY